MTNPPDVPNRKITLGDLLPELAYTLRDPLRSKESSIRRKEEESKKARAEAKARKEGRTIRYSVPE